LRLTSLKRNETVEGDEEMLGEEYKKESDGRTYLLLKKTKETFEEQMIQKAKPIGILPMARSEQKDVFKYEITGKKNLAMTFERVPMNAEQVETVLQGILDVLGRGREYLLSEDNFILCPEHIYLRIPEYEVTLCYYPEYGIPFAEQLGKLFEMLLNRVDYREEKAIAMVYALYMLLQEPDMTLERIHEKLREQAELSSNGVIRRTENSGKRAEERTVGSEREEKLILKTSQGEQLWEKEEQKRTGLWERLRKEIGVKRSMRGEKRESLTTALPIPCVRETASEWGTQYTKVLSVKREEMYPVLVSQRNGETVFLTKFPFYVGSLSNYTDYVIERDTVSRFHAKFIKQGETICLADLNSTNGTKVNGQYLNVREQVQLENGDRIMFADAEYVFYEKQG